MKYYKHFETLDGTERIKYFQPEGTSMCIPNISDNIDFSKMMEEVDAGTSTIEEVDETIVLTYADNRRAAYPAIGDQLDALYHAGVFPDDMAAKLKAVKDANPKG
jgi:hypothetical protein